MSPKAKVSKSELKDSAKTGKGEQKWTKGQC